MNSYRVVWLSRRASGCDPERSRFDSWCDTYFCNLFRRFGAILVHGANLNVVIPDTGGAPLTCRFGMMCAYTLRSHVAHAGGTFCFVAESCDLILQHAFWPYEGDFCHPQEGKMFVFGV